MLSNTRQDKILSYLKQHVSATVKELAAALYVSDATIRRDLIEMQTLGLLKRSHGGAVLLEAADEISIFVRMTENAKEKELAAGKALRFIPSDFKTVFLDSSSTVLALAQRMNLTDKTVITNSLEALVQLSKMRGVNLIVPGGNISPTGNSIMGSWTNTLLSDFHFDLMLTSCAAVIGRGAYETSVDQREVKRTVFDRSDCRILICGHSKFDQPGSYLFKDLSSFDKVVFDRLSPEEQKRFEGLPMVY